MPGTATSAQHDALKDDVGTGTDRSVTSERACLEDWQEATNRELEFLLKSKGPDGFFERLDREDCRCQIARRIKTWTSGLLDPSELRDVYQDTMLSLVRLVGQPNFDSKNPLKIVYHLAKCRAVDALRLLANRKAVVGYRAGDASPPPDELLSATHQFREALDGVIGNLPDRQQLVFSVFLENLPQFGRRHLFGPLAEKVSGRSKKPETPEGVRSALRAAAANVVAGLARRGWGVFAGLDPDESLRMIARAKADDLGGLDPLDRQVRFDKVVSHLQACRGPHRADSCGRTIDWSEISQALSARQQLVLGVYLENVSQFGSRHKFEPLAQLVSTKSNKAETAAGVRSALRVALQKVEAELVRRGWWITEGDTNALTGEPL